MKKSILYILFSICFLTISLGSIAQASDSLKLSYVPISNESDGTSFIFTGRIKIENKGTTPINNVVISVDSASGATVDAATITIGNVDVGKSIISEGDFTITTDANSTQESVDRVVVWDITYEDLEDGIISYLVPMPQ